MEYNKRQYNKTDNKKVLHKVKKNWVVMSMALLSAIGGGAAVSHATVHADTSAGNQNAASQSQSSVVPKAKLSTGVTSQSTNTNNVNSDAVTQEKTSSQTTNPNVIMHQAKHLYQNVLLNAANHQNTSQKQTMPKVSVGRVSANKVTNHVGHLLGTARGRKVYEITPTQEKQMKQKAQYQDRATKRPLLGASSKRNLGTSSSDGQIFIHYLIPSDNYKLAKNPEVTSDVTGTPFTQSDLNSFLTLIPGGYTNPRLDTRPGFNERPTEFKGTQTINIDVDKKKTRIGYLRIMYVDKNDNNIEEGQYVLSKPSDTKVQYSDIAGYLLLAPTGYITDNYKFYNPQKPGQPTKKNAYLGDVNPNTFNMKYETKMPTLDVEVVPSDSKPVLGKPIFIHYVNQHGVDVDTAQDAEPFTGDIGSTFNALESAPIPEGYHLAHPTNTSYTYQSDTQNFKIDVAGDALNSPLPFTINRTTNNGKSLPLATLNVNGQVGDTFTVDPNKYSQSGYYPDSKDQAYTGMIMPDKTLSKSQITYQYDANPTQQTAQPIHVYYYNQNGALVNDTTKDDNPIEGPLNSTVNLTGSDEAPVPNGYQLNPGQTTSYQIKNYTQNIPLFVTGIKQSKTLVIHRHEQIVNSDGQPGEPTNVKLSDMSDTVTNETGNTSTIPSSDFQPIGDVSANSDMFHNKVLMTPNGLDPSSIDFTYNTSYKHNHMSDEQPYGKVLLKDKDENNKVIKSIPVSGILGKPVNFNEVMSDITNLPSDKYLIKSDLSSEEFPQNPNAVYAVNGQYPVLVGDYGFATLDFEDDKSGQTLSRVPLKAPVGKTFDIMDPVKSFFNSDKNDQVASDSPYDPYTGKTVEATNTSKPDIQIYVEPKQQLVKATLLFEDQTNGNKQVRSLPISGKSGESINYKLYKQNIPSDYVYERIDPSDATTFEVKPLRGHDKYIMYVGRLVNAKIVYRDTSDNTQLSDVVPIRDVKNTNMQKYYDQYSMQVPMGYVLGNNNRNNWNKPLSDGATYTINVTPKQKSDIQATLKYIDDTDNQTVKSYTLNGKSGKIPTPIDYTKYSVPTGYQVDNSKVDQDHKDSVVKAGDINIIYVKPITVQGTITFNNESDGKQIKGSKVIPISDTPGSTITLSQYSDDVPATYVYSSDNPQTATLTANGQYKIKVKPKMVNVTISYEDDTNNNNLVDKVTVTGHMGSDVPYSKYSNQIPNSNYLYDRPGYEDQVFNKSDSDVIYVKPKQETTRINYFDSDNQLVHKSDVQGLYGHPFTYNVPNDYNMVSSSDTNPVYQNSSSDNVHVSAKQEPTTIDYLDNTTHKLIHSDKITGSYKHPFTYNVPSDYQMVSASDSNPVYQDHAPYSVYVEPRKETTTVDYLDNATRKLIHSDKVTGTYNQPFIYPSLKGYQMVSASDAKPVYQSHVPYKVYVEPQKATATVDYLDNTTHKLIYSNKITGSYDQPFNYTVPKGDRMVSASSQSPVYNDTTYDVYIEPTTVKPTRVTETLAFIDEQTGKPVGSTPMSGPAGTEINYNDYMNKIPAGYQYVGMKSYNMNYTNGFTSTMLVAKKNHNPQTSNVTARVLYYDLTNNKVVSTATISGPQSSTVDYVPYETEGGKYMPTGYHFVMMGRHDPQLKSGDVDVIGVDPNQPKVIQVPTNTNNNKPQPSHQVPASATVDIVYLTPSDDNVIADRPVTGQVGAPVNYNAYVPAGYRVTGSITGNQTFQTGGRAYVYVEPTSKATTPSNGSAQSGHKTTQHSTKEPGNSNVKIRHKATQPSRKTGEPVTNHLRNRITNSLPQNPEVRHSANGTVQPTLNNGENEMTTPQVGSTSNYSAGNYNANGYNEGNPQQSSGNKLPQTGERSSHAKEIAAALIALSAGIDALGLAVRRRRDDK